MPTNRSDLLDGVAADQAGLFTKRQALRCGYSAFQIRRRVATGHWRRVLGPVLGPAGRPVTALVRDRAAGLAVPGAVLCGPSAARRYGIAVPDSATWLAVHPSRRIRLAGVHVRRELIPDDDIRFIDGLFITTRDRAVFDCLRWLPERDAGRLLDEALQRRWIDLTGLTGRVHRFAGRPGINRLVRLVRGAAPGARSAAERLLHGHLRRAEIGGWRANEPIPGPDGSPIAVGDVVFRHVRLVIEVDGRAWHSAEDRFQRDRDRQNRLVAAGWTVLRFTWHDITERPGHVVDAVRRVYATLAARGA